MKSPFSARLRQARERLEMSQIELGVAIGLDETVASARISRYETGAMQQPPLETIAALAKALRVPQAFFFCETEAQASAVLEAAK